MTETRNRTVTILGINGSIGHHAARAFVADGWKVKGFGRSNKMPLSGVTFIKGDAENVADIKRAVEGSEVVLNALNLPYDKWDNGRAEAQLSKVVEGVEGVGKTLLFPGNIYNYSASLTRVTPDAPQNPETPRGAIRVSQENLLKQAAARGNMQVIILRAGDFYAPNNDMDWYDQGLLREAGKGKVAIPGDPDIGHSWAYLPDFGEAFARIAAKRDSLGAFESFHFEGHYVTHGALVAAIQNAAPMPLKIVPFAWSMLGLIGIFVPLMREVVKMRYLWDNSMQLFDPRLDALLGEDFGTPFETAVAETVHPFFSEAAKAAA